MPDESYIEGIIDRGSQRLWTWKYFYKYVSHFPIESENVEEYWFINAPNLAAARKELRKALQRYLTAYPEVAEAMERDLDINLRKYQKHLLSNIKPISKEALSRNGTDSPDWEDRLLLDLGSMSDLSYVTPSVAVAEVNA